MRSLAALARPVPRTGCGWTRWLLFCNSALFGWHVSSWIIFSLFAALGRAIVSASPVSNVSDGLSFFFFVFCLSLAVLLAFLSVVLSSLPQVSDIADFFGIFCCTLCSPA
jgi:hypothetical protein